MSTTERLFSDDDLSDVVSDLKEWPSMAWGNEQSEWAVSPFVSFYFLYDSRRWIETSLLMIDIHEEFERLTGYPYEVATHPGSERPYPYQSRRLPDLRDFARKTKMDDHFLFKVTSEKNHNSSPNFAGYFWKKPGYMNDDPVSENKIYSTIQLYYRWSWWLDNRDAWRRFVTNVIERLSPAIVYSGFAVATPLEHGSRTEATVWERSLASQFFGLDIDDPWAMDMHGDGIRPPTWGFFLSDPWREKLDLSREHVMDRLCHPQVTITTLSNGMWIELDDEPSLYPVEDGCPTLPSLLNDLIRGIRNDALDLVGFPQWDGDPNERFNRKDSMRWLQRFDPGSDWPTAELRRRPKQPAIDGKSAIADNELRGKTGESSPRTGRWQVLDSPD